MTNRLRVASVHGRFQPVHVEHMDYILAAFAEADFVHVGVTQYERARLVPVPGAGEHRNAGSSNPLSYFERAEILTRALRGSGIDAGRYRIGPFPIERQSELHDYLPVDVPILTTRVDAWNDRKIDLLRSEGYAVEVLYNRDPKGVSGDEIRGLMAKQDERWTELVPASTVSYLRGLDLHSRLAQL